MSTMTPRKLLLRLAYRLSNVWSSHADQGCENLEGALDCLDTRYRSLQQVRRAIRAARDHHLTLVHPQLLEALAGRLQVLRDTLGHVQSLLQQPRPPALDAAHWHAELRQLESEFNNLAIGWQEGFIGATTESITLEDVDLGPFAIRLYWDRLESHAGEQSFDIEALDPHPAADNALVTHPHVRDQQLCAGEAATPLRRALEQGRLADAFNLVRGVLRHYNASSPHVALEDWEGGEPCHDCGCTVRENDSSCCENCGHGFCEDCSSSCAECSYTHCSNCLSRCSFCDASCCLTCLKTLEHSQKPCCPSCRDTCTSCRAMIASTELDAHSGRCPACPPLVPAA
jgi:hypothetical protein